MTVVITGGNAGLGYQSALQLARAGQAVVLACRSPQRAEDAAARLRKAAPGAEVDLVRLDLADLASVADAARQLPAGIDALLCNGGITETRGRRTTADGFELMMGVNHLGHAALITAVLPKMAPDGRIVAVGSIAHRWSRLDLDDLQAERSFHSFRQYGRTKTAVMTYAFELDRRLRAAGSGVRALAAHPGFALDALTERPGLLLFQGKDAGAAPLVRACTGEGGQYWGPDGPQELTGPPALSRVRRHVLDPTTAARLWTATQRLTHSTDS